ncbi:MAG: hypothetical protein J7K48_08380 [Thermococcus sp.]|nr:hypothetical protein [Thermococcus sp.]
MPQLVDILAALSNLPGLDAARVYRLFFVLILLSASTGMYMFAYSLTRSPLSGFLASLVYSTAPLFAGKMSAAHMDHVFAYALIPFLFWSLEAALRKDKIRNYVQCGLILSLTAIARVDPIMLIFPFLGLYAVLEVLFGRPIKRLVRLIGITFPTFALASLYVWLPFFGWFVGQTAHTAPFDLSSLRSFALPLVSTFTGQGMPDEYGYLFWSGGLSYTSHPFLPQAGHVVVMFAFPFLAFLAPILRKNRITIAFSILALASLFLAKGLHPPFECLYELMTEKIPFFSNVHVPNRFLMVTWLSYSVLCGVVGVRALAWLRRHLPFAKGVVSTGIAAGFLVISFLNVPYIYTHGYRLWSPYSSYEEEIKAYEFLGGLEASARVATFPYATGRMATDELGHMSDLGTWSYAWHDKPVFTFLKKDDPASLLYKYTNYLQRRGRVSEFIRILSAYNVGFFLVNGYPFTCPVSTLCGIAPPGPTDHQEFFKTTPSLAQTYVGPEATYTLLVPESWATIVASSRGRPVMRPLITQGSTAVYENKNVLPRVFAPTSTMVIVGGLGALGELASLPCFEFKQWNLVWADHLAEHGGKEAVIAQLENADRICFADAEQLDLVFLIAGAQLLDLDKGRVKGLVRTSDPASCGGLVYGGSALVSTTQTAELMCGFKVDVGGEYEVWLRATSTGVGRVAARLDGEEIGTVPTSAQAW